MRFKLSSPGRAALAAVTAAGLLTGAFLVGTGQGRAAGAGAAAAAAADAAPALLARAPEGTATARTATTRITVTGTGSVTGTPDQLTLWMGVRTSGTSVSGALQRASQAVRAVSRALARAGVRAPDIQTSGLSITPSYGSGTPVPGGYDVSESIQVTLGHLASAGTQIGDAVRAGGNATVVEGVSLSLSGTSSLLASARVKAVADARTKAAQYARALGRPLGPAVSLSEQAPYQPLPLAGEAAPAGAPGRATAVPVHPGSQQLQVTVTVTFALG